MGYPIPYAGVMPKLLLTAAISIATLRDLCISLLESLGIITFRFSHHYNSIHESNYSINDSASSIHSDYLNPHLHAPADHPHFLRRTAFFETVRASMPVVLYENLPCKCPVQEWELVQSVGLAGPALEKSVSSSSFMAPSIPSSASSSLCSSALHVSCSPPAEFERTNRCHIHQPSIASQQPELSLPCSCGASAATPQVDDHSQKHTVACKLLQKQALAAQSPISVPNIQERTTESPYACVYHLQHPADCAVCLCEFEKGEEVRELPSCSHIFHKDCIDGWLLHSHRTCPLCRSSLLTPAAVEMQEMMRKQELSDQLSSWFNSLQQEENAAYQDHYLQYHHILDHHQDFYYTLQQPAGN